MYPQRRPRRLRQKRIQKLVRETTLSPSDLVHPVFVDENLEEPWDIESMPGYQRLPLDHVAEDVKEALDLGIPSVILFGVPREKDERGSHAWGDDDIVQRAVRKIKEEAPGATVITDVCLCEYTSHGHCGVVEGDRVLNDETLPLLGKTAVSHARAGADIVAPSGMMDGMVDTIRVALDGEGYQDTLIMSYAVKYASSFYGPFRDAADSGYEFGDRSEYQMDPANTDEALMEAGMDLDEGADILMVKPALPYLDVIRRVKDEYGVPLAAYNVSGEYAMLKAADRMGWLDGRETMTESLTSIKRAGADMIITYFAKDMARLLR